MALHMFVDESKARSYVLAGVTCPTESLQAVRATLMGFLLPGQTRLHFSKERDHRRSAILKSLISTQVRAVVIETPKKPTEIEARARALRRLIRNAAEISVARLVIEQDASSLLLDKRIISESLAFVGNPQLLSYTWMLPQQEPLLWVADAYAWAWSAGKGWKSIIRPAVDPMKLAHP